MHNGPELDTTQMSTIQWMDEQIGVVTRHKKNRTIGLYMDKDSLLTKHEPGSSQLSSQQDCNLGL